MQDLGSIQLNQKMTGVQLVAADGATPPNPLVSFNGLQLSVSPAGAVTFANQTATPALPAGSTFTVDIIPALVGQAIITAQGQQYNFGPTFQTMFTIEVIAAPAPPDYPTQWLVTAGSVVSQ
jgi:hypothetical protein